MIMYESTKLHLHLRLLLALAFTALAAVAGAQPAGAAFGVQPGTFQSAVIDSSGNPVAEPQAGAHPFAQQLSFAFNQGPTDQTLPAAGPGLTPEGQPKTIITNLPAGLIGNPQAVPRCAQHDFPPRGQFGYSSCSTASQVGLVSVGLGVGPGLELPSTVALYNLTPPKGVVARLGFVAVLPVVIDITVRSGGDYGITATISDTAQGVNIYNSTVTIWGVPADPVHDVQRFLPGAFYPGDASGNPLPSGLQLTPFLTNPSQCGVAQSTTLQVDSWQEPGNLLSYTSAPQTFTGCDRLAVRSTLSVTPTSAGAGEPTGLAIDLGVDQPSAANALGSPPLKRVSITLPEGVTVSPSSADGLGACTAAQIGIGNAAPAACPDSSKIGSVEIDTPLLEEPLEGSVYLAQPGAGNNPFGSLIALYLVAEGNGVVVKLPGQVALDPTTGRVVSTFDNAPQLPFSRLLVTLKGGPRAPLSQADVCGTQTTSATLTSWGGQTITEGGSYAVHAGSGSPSCGAQGFSPQLTAGTLSPVAGAGAPFSFQLTRTDADQQLSSVQTTLPAGLLGSIKSVPLCQAAEAAAGTCTAASQIGEVTVGSGPGSSPFYINTGRAYLTTGYKGAPFGLSIVVPAIAGPFDLGTVVVRAALNVDPVTTRVSVATDPFPTILQGIPLQVRDVRLLVDRPGFMFNPTSCGPLAVNATITSTQGTQAAVSSGFQVGECSALAFKPSLSAATQAKTSKLDGASLVIKVGQKSGEANIRKVQLQIPSVLPTRLKTLQQACTEAQFNANPAGCPAGSHIGTATAHTPILAAPLSGPAILVSHGGAAFPDVEFLLSGENVHVTLDGKTNIRKGITYASFETVPDAPISSFETTLPEGPHSIFTANGNLCDEALSIPTTIVGQNGAQVTQVTKVSTTGCAKASVKVLGSSVNRSGISVTFKTSRAGAVSFSGVGLKSVKRSFAAGTHTIKLVLDAQGKVVRSQHRKIRITLRLRATGGSAVAVRALKL
jgi:hypothetical protein